MTISNSTPDISAEETGTGLGHFELPTPETLNRDANNAMKGALQATWDESDEASAGQHDDFPMIVWLRGDEPWFTQFDMDAEAVMHALGIKRSRLTQISGRELRVGRVRVDRYIRPVYRSNDIEKYLAWTRATASHQKSSDAIKTAVEQLHEQTRAVQTGLDSISRNFTDHIKQEMSVFISTTIEQGLAPLDGRLENFQTTIASWMTQLTHQVSETLSVSTEQLKTTTETLRETARHQAAALEVLTLQVNQTSEKAKAMEERLSAWDNLLMNNLKLISDDLAALKKPATFRKAAARKHLKATSFAALPAKPKLTLRSAPARRKAK